MEIRTRVKRQSKIIYELLPIDIARNMMNKNPLTMLGLRTVTAKSTNVATLVE